MAQAKEMLEELKDQAPEADPFPTIRESLAELGANPDKYEKILAKTDDKFHWEKVFRPKTTLEVGAITLLAAAKQSGAEPNEYLSRLAPYFESRIKSLPDLYNVSGYVKGDAPTRAVLTRTARELKGSAYTLPHELEHTLQGIDGEKVPPLYGVKIGESVKRYGLYDRNKADLLDRLSKVPLEEREEITAKHPVFGRYLSQGDELFARIRAKEMLDSAKGQDFLQTELGQKLFPTDKDRAYFVGSTLPGVPTIAPPYDFESTDKNRKPLADPNTSYARQLYNKLVAPKEYQEGGEVTDEFPEEAGVMPGQNPSEAAKQMLFYKKTAAPTPPTDLARLGKQAGLIGLGFAPGSGVADYFGKFPAVEGGTEPSAVENFQKGNYGTAALQGLGAMGDLAMAVPVAGAAIGSVMKAPRTAQRILSSSTTAKDDLAKMPKKLAPANESGFYSPTEAAALNLQRKSGTGQAFLNDLMKGENVKSDEISAMGLDTFLKDKKNVTTAEVQDFIAQNKIKLGETVYGVTKEDPVGLAKRKEVFDKYEPEIQSLYADIDSMPLYMKAGDRSIANPRRMRMEDALNDLQLKRDAEADAVYTIPENKETKFGSYSLPGGENYREIVLTLPPKAKAKNMDEAFNMWMAEAKAGKKGYFEPNELERLTPDDINEILHLDYMTPDKKNIYSSTHWDEQNPLAHLRVSDRVTDGKKTLLVDEVQSDWHQQGREKGYKSDFKTVDWNDPDYVKARSDAVNATNAFNGASGNRALQKTLEPEMERTNQIVRDFANRSNQRTTAVPDAPYKDDWYQLTLRRGIKEAVDGGYDRIALPTGARVAERFDLSKQADGVFWSPDKKELTVKTKSGDYAPVASGISDQEISKYVGNDVAKRLLSTEQENIYGVGKVHSLLGEELTVGGEGMKKYYDEIYPGYLQKFGKKYGADSGKTTVDVKGKPEPLFYMDITPKMREEFTSGIPMREGGEVRRYL
jgi:hypothetical protein